MFFKFGIFEGDRERRGDRIPETAFALMQKLLYWNASPQKLMPPTDRPTGTQERLPVGYMTSTES